MLTPTEFPLWILDINKNQNKNFICILFAYNRPYAYNIILWCPCLEVNRITCKSTCQKYTSCTSQARTKQWL